MQNNEYETKTWIAMIKLRDYQSATIEDPTKVTWQYTKSTSM